MAERIKSYRAFWLYYLTEHSTPICRAWHYAGSSLAIVGLLAFLLTWNFWFLALMLVGGYGPAWLGHYLFEHNRPATFQYPLWSLVSDFRMYFLFLAGRLGRELARAGVGGRGEPREPAKQGG